MLQRLVLLVFLRLNIVVAEMEGYVVDGERLYIEEVPHSVFMDIFCGKKEQSSWICGGSILNQYFTLTAAHCVKDCTRKGHISLSVGHEHKKKGYVTSAARFKIHEDFEESTMAADIAIVKMKIKLTLGPKIKRVVIMRYPPYEKGAYVAGWGLITDRTKKTSPWLRGAKQIVWNRHDCVKVLQKMPQGSMCAAKLYGYSASGDSGGALIIRNYIQIGIVSYKEAEVSKSLVVYTNVSYFYDWIIRNTKNVFCG